MQLIFDYSSTSSLGILLESAIASSAPAEFAFLLGFVVLGFFLHFKGVMQPKIGRQKKLHVPAIQGTGQTLDSSSPDLKQLVSEVYI